MSGTLFLVATPIGNLGDISIRALEILKSVDIIACEDTRQTRKLLTHFGISARLMSYHEHNEQERAEELKNLLLVGKNVALVTDAGTPGIADPAFRAVQATIEAGITIVPIPGAVAFVNAAIVSGLPTDALFFGNFLPARKTERRRRLQEIAEIPATLVFYETPHRLQAALADCLEILGNRRAAVLRELTKLHEEVVRGDLKELIEKFSETPPRGEIVLVIDRNGVESQHSSEVRSLKTIGARVAELEAEGLNNRAALKQAAREFGVSRSEAYRRLVEEKKL
ncbi:MAG: 16S rRNA (cytidine(1402)-2'-O)-methyltransferase [Acidobacteriota bacterium]|nr:16S rRNA (cytidine(1402)-2'-O)-methyltransferase [Acidobacteriota bacterium]